MTESSTEAAAPSALRRWVGFAARVALAVGLLAYAMRPLFGKRDELEAMWRALAPGWLAAAFVATCACFPLGASNWRAVMRAFGVEWSPVQSFRVVYASNLAKYLPGGVWNLLGRVALARVEGLPVAPAGIGIFLEFMAQCVGIAVVALVSLGAAEEARLPFARWMLAPAALLVLLGGHPRLVNFVLALVARVTRQTLPKLRVGYGGVLALFARYVAAWALFSLGFVLIARATVGALDAVTIGVLVAALSIAWLVSLFAFVVPGGIGVRETLFVSIAGLRVTPSQAAVLALGVRFGMLLVEILMFVVSLWLRRVPVTASGEQSA
jgi:glycosyltransferase 2 family protein